MQLRHTEKMESCVAVAEAAWVCDNVFDSTGVSRLASEYRELDVSLSPERWPIRWCKVKAADNQSTVSLRTQSLGMTVGMV